MKSELIKKIAVAFEISGGTPLSKDALSTIISHLENYDETEIAQSLEKCRNEVRGRLYLADIIQRIPKKQNGRPTADEAFAMLPFDERQSVVWTAEMSEAFAIIRELHQSDPIGARMAFRDAYERLCSEAINRGELVSWTPSLGEYKAGRETSLKKAVEKGRLKESQVRLILPDFDFKRNEQLPAHEEDEDIQTYINRLKKQMGYFADKEIENTNKKTGSQQTASGGTSTE